MNNSNFKIAPPTSATQVINNIIHANTASPSSYPSYPPSSSDVANGVHPFTFSQQELRKLEELKKVEEMRKIDEIRATVNSTGAFPMHKVPLFPFLSLSLFLSITFSIFFSLPARNEYNINYE